MSFALWRWALLTVVLLLGAAACGWSRIPVHTETGSWQVSLADAFWLEDEEQVRQFLKDTGVLSTDCCQPPEGSDRPPDPRLRYLVIQFHVRNVDDRRPATYEGVRHMAYNGWIGRLAEPDGASQYALNRNAGTYEPSLAPGDRVLDAFVFRMRPGAERLELWIETFAMSLPPFFPLTIHADRIQTADHAP